MELNILYKSKFNSNKFFKLESYATFRDGEFLHPVVIGMLYPDNVHIVYYLSEFTDSFELMKDEIKIEVDVGKE